MRSMTWFAVLIVLGGSLTACSSTCCEDACVCKECGHVVCSCYDDGPYSDCGCEDCCECDRCRCRGCPVPEFLGKAALVVLFPVVVVGLVAWFALS